MTAEAEIAGGSELAGAAVDFAAATSPDFASDAELAKKKG